MEAGEMRTKLEYYDQDGQRIEGGALAWAELFEDSKSRIIGQSKTLYGEKLSTVWLGIDHNWGDGPPLIFETMLFAPSGSREQRMEALLEMRDTMRGTQGDEAKVRERERREAWTKKHYPHDQLQLRYSTKEEAARSHNRLWWACIIPPRWRRFLLYTIGENEVWN
jgi:hypothetical protein